MPKEVITRVDALGKAGGQRKLLTFYNHKGQLIGDHPDYNEIPGVLHQIPGVDHETTGVEMDQEQEQFDESPQDGLEDPPPSDEKQHNQAEMLAELETEPVEIRHEAEVPENQPTVQPDLPVQDPVPLQRSTRNRQPIQRLDPTMSGKRHAKVTLPIVKDVSDDTQPDYDFVMMFICMMQLSMKASLKRFGQQGEEAATKEQSQLHLKKYSAY